MEFDRYVSGITQEAMEYLVSHDWPGNIRELENALERAVLLSRGDGLTSADFHLGVDPVQIISFGLGSHRSADSMAREQGEPGYAGEVDGAGDSSDVCVSGDAYESDGDDQDSTIDIPGDVWAPEDGVMSLEELERRYIAQVLEQCGDNRTHAARILKITRRTLLNKIKKYGL